MRIKAGRLEVYRVDISLAGRHKGILHQIHSHIQRQAAHPVLHHASSIKAAHDVF